MSLCMLMLGTLTEKLLRLGPGASLCGLGSRAGAEVFPPAKLPPEALPDFLCTSSDRCGLTRTSCHSPVPHTLISGRWVPICPEHNCLTSTSHLCLSEVAATADTGKQAGRWESAPRSV